MAGQILLYIGSALTVIWGIAHLFPTRSVVQDFGDISTDNKRIITMEWIIEGIFLIFIGVLVCAVTIVDPTSVVSKVVYEYNCTDAPGVTDIFGHGTGVAFLIAGGLHGGIEKAGVSPGASIMNIKVLNDEGIGTDEAIVMGIEKVCDLAQSARTNGLWPTNEMYPNIINISFPLYNLTSC